MALGNHAEADTELERIPAQLRVHPDVLEIRWNIFAHAKKWEACVDIAAAIIRVDPDRPEGWTHRSFALHELKRTQEAFDLLAPVVERFPENWTIPYNLACYCAQLGRLAEAKRWLGKALAIDRRSVQEAAIDDPDLEPLRGEIGGTRRGNDSRPG